MAQDEIWDDSSLIESWDEALKEYKKYHSIHLKGGQIPLAESKTREGDQERASTAPQEIESSREGEDDVQGGIEFSNENKSSSTHGTDSQQNASVPKLPLPLTPATMLASVQDENLKRLLMSWYYAGYYTGLYEGQQGKASGDR